MLRLLDDILCAIHLETVRSIHHKTVYAPFIIRQSMLFIIQKSPPFIRWQLVCVHSPYDNPHSIHHMTVPIPFTIWQSTLHSPYNGPHSIHHKIRTVYTPFIIWRSPLQSYDSLYSLHSIHHMVVSALFITWQSLFYSSHASLHSIHHMPVSTLVITWQSLFHSS